MLAAVLLGLAGAVTVSALTTPQYRASALLFVTTNGDSTAAEAYQGNLFGQQRVLSYAELASSRQVAQRTISEMKLNMLPDQLMLKVTAERVPIDTVMFEITVSDSDPDMARDLANVVAQQTTIIIEQLESSAPDGTAAATAVVVDEAETPTTRAEPVWTRNIAVGLLGGLLIGLVGAVVRDQLDRSTKSTEDAAAAADAPLVGAVPPRPRGASGVPFGVDKPKASEAFRMVRTNLLNGQSTSSADASRVILVAQASPSKGAEVATVTLGLAAALAEYGRSALVIDADLRERAVSEALDLGAAPGLWDVLEEEAFLDQVTMNTEFDGLKVLPAGPAQQQPGQLLGAQRTRELIKQLRSEYEYVLIAGPPVLPYSDDAVMAGSTDGALLVAGIGATSTVDLSAAACTIRMVGVELIGVVTVDAKRRLRRTADEA